MADHKHIFQQAKTSAAPTLVLLHGTGGNERDLMPIAEMIDERAAVLGVRGNVSENGMPRFLSDWLKACLTRTIYKSGQVNCIPFLIKQQQSTILTVTMLLSSAILMAQILPLI